VYFSGFYKVIVHEKCCEGKKNAKKMYFIVKLHGYFIYRGINLDHKLVLTK